MNVYLQRWVTAQQEDWHLKGAKVREKRRTGPLSLMKKREREVGGKLRILNTGTHAPESVQYMGSLRPTKSPLF